MTELNFGLSDYDEWEYTKYLATGKEGEFKADDMIVVIPKKIPLEKFYYQEKELMTCKQATITFLKPNKSKETYIAVEFSFPWDVNNYNFVEHTIFMPWIEERSEWVVLEYEKNIESFPRHDENYSYPYSLNDYCCKKILEAYKILETKINNLGIKLEEVAKISPKQLETIKNGV